MNQELQDGLKKKLHEEKESLERELATFADKDKNVAGDFDTRFPDYGDEEEQNAAEVADYAKNLDLEAKMEVKLLNVKKALKRIAIGKYGVCESCDKEISPERLKALPSAGECLECQEKSGPSV
ncbi:TraR/DksA family transcriptional regulator [Patescibacteria group bacterium]|nr:TraR/DksA family transcriptional regulator [Patescibacteria group bacterium]